MIWDWSSLSKFSLGRGAVAAALEDTEEFVPRAYGLAILVGEDARDLVEVGEVVDCPGGDELG